MEFKVHKMEVHFCQQIQFFGRWYHGRQFSKIHTEDSIHIYFDDQNSFVTYYNNWYVQGLPVRRLKFADKCQQTST